MCHADEWCLDEGVVGGFICSERPELATAEIAAVLPTVDSMVC